MIASGGILGFLLMLSYTKGIDLLPHIAIMAIAAGLTATSRLSMKAHKGHELIFGFVLGLISQILVVAYSL